VISGVDSGDLRTLPARLAAHRPIRSGPVVTHRSGVVSIGPFGQTERYGPRPWCRNALVHELRRRRGRFIPEFSTAVDEMWTTPMIRGEARLD
jgi:hypothetical protein